MPSLLTLGGTALAWAVIIYTFNIRELGYDFYDVTDTPLYFSIMQTIRAGHHPYRDFLLAYPPLAVPLFTLPVTLAPILVPLAGIVSLFQGAPRPAATDLTTYSGAFAAEMILLSCLMNLTVVGTLIRRGATTRHRGLVVGLCAMALLACGAIVANRYDIAVALDLSLAVGAIMCGWLYVGAIAIGLGIALKLIPVLLLPLLLMLCRSRGEVARTAGLCAAAAVIPFLPYVGAPGLEYIISSAADRPLQIESVLATPLWIGHLLGLSRLRVDSAFGSQFLTGPVAASLARLSPLVAIVTLGATYLLIWNRRRALRADSGQAALAACALVTGFLISSKLLSPQFLIWLLPFIPLLWGVRRGVVLAIFAALVLTQVEFPARYWALVHLDSKTAGVVVARNAALLLAFILAWSGLQKPGSPSRQEKSGPGGP
ncbi:MAG TPA: hypothetical protein VI504_13465 [Candidatus Eisenbacteria bacterium]